MSMSLSSIHTADLESVRSRDIESFNVVEPPRSGPEDVEKNIQRVFESVRTEHPETALEALIHARSIIQRGIDFLSRQKDSRNHKKDGAEVPKVPNTRILANIPKATESTNVPEEEDVSSHAHDGTSSQNSDSDKGESDDEGTSCTDDYTDEEPVYDKADDVYRCAKPGCGWEVAFGYCHGCKTKYMTEDGENEAVDPRDPFTVFRDGILARSNSPPPEPIPSHLRPLCHNRNPRSFDELISRGATLAFCETWEATFDEENGIIVLANSRLREAYDAFIGEHGHWSIWVGRRIKLSEHDPDGSLFMDDLLDMIFTQDDGGHWITYTKPGGFWVTRPEEGLIIPGDAEVVEVPEDLWTSEEEGDPESSVGSYVGETSQSEAESTSNPQTSDCESTWWSDDSESEAGPEEEEIEGGVQVDEAVEEKKDGTAF